MSEHIDPRTEFQRLALWIFARQKAQGEKAMAQLSDEQLFAKLDPESNSIAILVRHLYGNMRSRWTDLLTTDGEKSDRKRDDEFIEPAQHTRHQVMSWWEDGWRFVFDAIKPLRPDDIDAIVTIRREPLSVMAAILRQIDHYGHHVGQIVLLAKHLRGDDWETLSIPRGKSEEYLRS
jgi:hypothetical protein